MSSTEKEYKEHIKHLEQQILLLKEQVDFLIRKLYGTKSEKTSALQIEGQMSLFNEVESCADPNAQEPDLVEVEKHLRKRNIQASVRNWSKAFRTAKCCIRSMTERRSAKNAEAQW